MPAAEVMLPGSVVNSVVAENILNNNNNNNSGGLNTGNNNGSTMNRLRRPPPSHLPPLSETGVRCNPASSPPASSVASGSFMEGHSGGSWNPELMSGSLTLVGPGNKHSQSVQVKVYRTSLEHFAVIYPQKKVCRPLGVLNLRNAHVERLCDTVLPSSVGNCPKPVDLKKTSQGDRMGFVVRQRGFDSPFCLTFLLEGPSTSPFAATLSGGAFPQRAVQKDLNRDLEQWMAAFRCAPGGGLSPSSPLPPGVFPSPPPSPVPSSPSMSPRGGDLEGHGGNTSPQQRAGRRCTAATRHHQPPCLAIVEEEEV
ncbi:uncharacterized protein LOC124153646 [Ischnura elegans]|uniref:uncharacterized protein LOC124153646 n=1 Tax=Ischnura elegans TaxID=197161 RepID=UPI001ED8AA44|nr:uncharacterized protein LOC124153646 [Ischnura elegans]